MEWPRLVPLIRRLARGRDSRVYLLLNKLWRGWAIKNRIHPVWHFVRIKS